MPPTDLVREPTSRVPRPTVESAAVASMCGLLLVAVAYALGRSQLAGGSLCFWVGQILLFLPIVDYVLRAPERRRSIEGLILLLGLGTYLVKLMYSPSRMEFGDEFQHLRGLSNVLAEGRVAVENPSLPISLDFPGLQSVSGVLARLLDTDGQLPGFIIAGVAHVGLLAFVYLLLQEIFGSPRAGALGAVVYATNSSFEFFNSYFVYETLALPFAVATLFGAWRLRDREWRDCWPTLTATYACFWAALVSHHITSIYLSGILVIILMVSLMAWRRAAMGPLVALCSASLATAAVYFSVTFGDISAYFRPYTSDALNPGTKPQYFPSDGLRPQSVPVFDRGATYVGFVTLALAVVVGLWFLLRRRTGRGQPWLVPLAVPALAFLLSLPVGKLLPFGGQIYGRSASFTYLGVAFAVVVVLMTPRVRSVNPLPILVGFAVVLMGGLAVAAPPFWSRLPGHFYPKGYESGVDNRVFGAAAWSRHVLGPGNVFLADGNGQAVLGTLGHQIIAGIGDQVFYAPRLNPQGLNVVKTYTIRYAWVDQRMVTIPSPSARYFYGSSNGYFDAAPKAALLRQFYTSQKIDRVYDDGEIRIYDMARVIR